MLSIILWLWICINLSISHETTRVKESFDFEEFGESSAAETSTHLSENGSGLPKNFTDSSDDTPHGNSSSTKTFHGSTLKDHEATTRSPFLTQKSVVLVPMAVAGIALVAGLLTTFFVVMFFIMWHRKSNDYVYESVAPHVENHI